MEMESLQELLVEELKDIYNAESQLLKAMPKMAKKAKNQQLKTAFETHMKETEGQIERLEQVLPVWEAGAPGQYQYQGL